MSWRSLPVKGLIETSFLDWKGRLSSVLFLGGCNFRCPFCHNRDLVLNPASMEDMPVEYVMATLRKYSKWVDKVVITGGEPTIHMGLYELIGELKSRGMGVKLDTNGSNPEMVKGLVNEGLVDYIAMDIKGPIDEYQRWCGVDVDKELIQESIEFIMEDHVDYEFRMTVVPFLHHEDDIYRAASYVKDARKFYIQEFRPQITLNAAYESIKPFSPDMIRKIKANVAEILAEGSRSERMSEEGQSIKNETP